MRQVIVNVYRYDELKEKAKLKVLRKLQDINVDYDWWEQDGLLDLSEKEMSIHHISPVRDGKCMISYRIAAFDIDREWFIRLEDIVVNHDEEFRQFLGIPKYLWENCYYAFINNYRSVNTELVIEENDQFKPFTDSQCKIIREAEGRMNNKIKETLVSLKTQYEYLLTREAIEETVQINDFEFTEDGALFT